MSGKRMSGVQEEEKKHCSECFHVERRMKCLSISRHRTCLETKGYLVCLPEINDKQYLLHGIPPKALWLCTFIELCFFSKELHTKAWTKYDTESLCCKDNDQNWRLTSWAIQLKKKTDSFFKVLSCSILMFLHHHAFSSPLQRWYLCMFFFTPFLCLDRVSYIDHYSALMARYETKPSEVLCHCHWEAITRLMVQLYLWDFTLTPNWILLRAVYKCF